MGVFVIGLNHRTASVQVREQFAIAEDQVAPLIGALQAEAGLTEAVVLSTCNRFEVYGVTCQPVSWETIFETILKFPRGSAAGPWDHELTRQNSQPLSRPIGGHRLGLEPLRRLEMANDGARIAFETIAPCLYFHENEAAVQHLFRVASSLDSLMVGETEIVGQIKKAYQRAQASGGTGKVLNRFFQKAFSVSKEVRTRSGIGRCSTSVGSVSVDLAAQLFGEDLSAQTVLIIGAGKIGETTLRHLAKRGARSILVCNRSFERAEALATEFSGRAVPFAGLVDALARADIVISSTSAPGYVVGMRELGPALARRGSRPLFLIDLAVPRDIDPLVLQSNGVYLYNIDQLDQAARQNLDRRQAEAAACERLVASQAWEFAERCRPLFDTPMAAKPIPAGRGGRTSRFPECSPLIPAWIAQLLRTQAMAR